MTTLDKTYQPHAIEQHWYQTWEKNHYFTPNHGKDDAFSIMLPPPNVTGSLHMGHGFGFTLMDIVIRYQRMSGKNTLWQAGTDHAGIATQMVVERQLHLAGTKRQDIGREKFLEKVWEWKKESGGNITRQARRLGASLDWQRERFTMDEDYCFAVREVFIQLYNEGLIYRGTRLVNWDPVLLTAVSDLEVINQEEQGHLWHIRYPLIDAQPLPGQATHTTTYLVVATTRPETLLGDVAVAVHPDDERYQHLIGKQLQLPLTERTIPIIADDYVDPTFGTGCVKITPAHDFNDYEVGLRHQLTPINIFTPTATLNDNAPVAYRGLDRFVARKQIIKDLEAQDLLDKIEKHILKVPRGEKSEAIIEPYLTQQWFLKMEPLAKPAIAAVERGDVRFIPENWGKTYYQWMHHIQDWCISRQLWWGHRIPIWHTANGESYAGHDEQDVRQRYQLPSDLVLTQDGDVLDTWFSAGLWPFATLGWPQKTIDLAKFFPTDLLVTGFDIIFFWVARMIMFSLKFTGEVPFREVYITGLIRDAEGQKMSKSKGNVLDPIDLIDGIELEALVKKRLYGLMQASMKEKIEANTRKEYPQGIPSFGTDALRFTFCSIASYTREIRFDMSRLAGYRNFCNKLWNAARYIMMNTVEQDTGLTQAEKEFSLADKWILSQLQHTITHAHEAMQQYRFDLFAQGIYDFIWNEFCDWYLELSKPILTDENSTPAMLRGTRYTLVNVFETLLRLLHPIMPYITEELWQRIAPLAGCQGESVMLATYPQANNKLIDDKIEQQLTWLKNIIIAIRTIRSEMNIAPGKLLPILLRKGSQQDRQNLQQTEALFTRLAKIASIQWLDDATTPPPSATAFLGELEVYIPMAEFINAEEELARLTKEIMKCEKELAQVETKLQNPNFADKAPAEVVAKERAKQTELKATLIKLMEQKERQCLIK